MTLREAAQQALEALYMANTRQWPENKIGAAINTLSAALAEPEQDDTALLRQALEALELALSSHGTMLLSDPPQEAWKAYGVDGKGRAAITALRERLEGKT